MPPQNGKGTSGGYSSSSSTPLQDQFKNFQSDIVWRRILVWQRTIGNCTLKTSFQTPAPNHFLTPTPIFPMINTLTMKIQSPTSSKPSFAKLGQRKKVLKEKRRNLILANQDFLAIMLGGVMLFFKLFPQLLVCPTFIYSLRPGSQLGSDLVFGNTAFVHSSSIQFIELIFIVSGVPGLSVKMSSANPLKRVLASFLPELMAE
ncbi:hypothetical protein CDAR_622411 [Caerostris darwini]|uniref:Uncharacterized protein n=1 Tax=Caerostris darwini TaxID=1538125 RepID=A0AAV4W2J1_9ARAC|nr:hypothetical protein CDAR_622411 [Caerostris darwini]